MTDAETRHRALFACFRSEQMSLAQLHGHMAEEPAFARYVETASAEIRAADRRRAVPPGV